MIDNEKMHIGTKFGCTKITDPVRKHFGGLPLLLFALAYAGLDENKKKKRKQCFMAQPPTMYIRMKGRLDTPFSKFCGFVYD